jgi:hypothetical protein
VLIDPQPGPDAAHERVQAILAEQCARLEEIAGQVAAMTPEERLEWSIGGVLELLRSMEGVRAALTPLAMQADELVRWRAGVERWMASVNSHLARTKGLN